jgi:hypothetical protein
MDKPKQALMQAHRKKIESLKSGAPTAYITYCLQFVMSHPWLSSEYTAFVKLLIQQANVILQISRPL